MDCIFLSNQSSGTNCSGGVSMLGDSVDGVLFSLEPGIVFVEGYIIMNIVLLGLYMDLFSFEGQIIIGS